MEQRFRIAWTLSRRVTELRIMQALLRDPTYRPALEKAAAMVS